MLDTSLINELIDILNKETALYNDILEISKKKTKTIVEGKVTELENLTKVEQSLVLQMGRAEDRREELVEKISAVLGVPSEELTVSEINKRLEEDHADRLKQSQESMAKVLSELKNANDLNSRLIKNSLDYIDFSINLLSSVDSGVNNYGGSGQVNEGQKRSFLDVKL